MIRRDNKGLNNVIKIMRRFAIVTVVLIFEVFSSHQQILQAAEPNVASAIVNPQQKSSGGYCGIYCLYGAMRFFGVHVEPNEMLKPEYIGSSAGSSLAELKKCAEAHGLHAMPVARLTTKDLRDMNLPVIIHVKSSPIGRTYNHYELFMGARPFDSAQNRQALIYDPPRPAEKVEFWTIAPRWDGTGLIVSDKPIQISKVFASSRWRFVFYVGISLAIVLAIRTGRRYWTVVSKTQSSKQAIRVSIIQCAAICLMAAASAFAYHSINDEGLLIRKTATANIQKAYEATFIPRIAAARAQRLSVEKSAVFVDPRPDYIFKKNHLQDAINVSAFLTKDERIKATAGIDKNRQIIICCDNSTRRLAEAVALQMRSDGFSNVAIYNGKWEQLAK